MDWGKVVPYHNPFRMREVPLFLTREVPLFLMRKVPLFLMREVPLYANICAVTDGGLTAMDWGKVLPKAIYFGRVGFRYLYRGACTFRAPCGTNRQEGCGC